MTRVCLSLIRQLPPSFRSLGSCCGKACTHSFVLSLPHAGTTCVWEEGVTVNCPPEHSHLSIRHPLQCLCQANNERNKPDLYRLSLGALCRKKKKKKDCCFFKSWGLPFAVTAFQLLNKLRPWAAVRQILHCRLQLKGAPDKHFSA